MIKQPQTVRERLQQQYATARSNLLLMLIFTVVNIVLLVVESNTMFLFSATVPYFSVALGLLSEDAVFLGIYSCFAVVVLVLYALCWLLSKNHRGWMITALVLFILDTIALLGICLLGSDISGIFDALIHIWVLYYLVLGVISSKKLRDLPSEEVDPIDNDNVVEQAVNVDAPDR